MNNVIFLRFLNKSDFPPGPWMQEPDVCYWYHSDLNCLALRDMSLGNWKSFVGVNESHLLYSKNLDEILRYPVMMDAYIDVHGGITSAGKLPNKYKEEASFLWWFGIDTSHGSDTIPLLKRDDTLPFTETSYKSFSFIRRETNKLASYIAKLK